MSLHHLLRRPALCSISSHRSNSFRSSKFASLTATKSSTPSQPLTSILYVPFPSTRFSIPNHVSSYMKCSFWNKRLGNHLSRAVLLLDCWARRRNVDIETPICTFLERVYSLSTVCVVRQSLQSKVSSYSFELLIYTGVFSPQRIADSGICIG